MVSALQEQMLPMRFRQFERFLASAGVDAKLAGGKLRGA